MTGDWRIDVLYGIDARVTRHALLALDAWRLAENTKAQHNWLANTRPMPGATLYNSARVRNYPSHEIGVEATVLTLLLPRHGYPKIVDALRRDARPEVVARAVAESSWGTGELVLRVLANTKAREIFTPMRGLRLN